MGNESYIDLLSKYSIAKYININDKTERKSFALISQNAKEVLSIMISSGENIILIKEDNGNIYGSISFNDILNILKEEDS